MFLDPSLNPKCNECRSMDIDQTFKKVFGHLVCNKCKNEQPEKYSLLTKTECKEVSRNLYGINPQDSDTAVEDYLLTDGMLRDIVKSSFLMYLQPSCGTKRPFRIF
jgi:hypothetical protein